MEYEWHKQDGRFSVCSPVVELMVSGAAEICAQLWSSYQYSPFHDNENAGVSILLGGASKKGLLAVSEYPVDKKAWAIIQKKRDGRKLNKKDIQDLIVGRADLWITDQNICFSFEFKKTSERDGTPHGPKRTINDLTALLKLAAEEVDRLDGNEYNHALGGIIAPVFDQAKEPLYCEFAKKSHLALSIGSGSPCAVYLYFTGKR